MTYIQYIVNHVLIRCMDIRLSYFQLCTYYYQFKKEYKASGVQESFLIHAGHKISS